MYVLNSQVFLKIFISDNYLNRVLDTILFLFLAKYSFKFQWTNLYVTKIFTSNVPKDYICWEKPFNYKSVCDSNYNITCVFIYVDHNVSIFR